jgi:maltooligosyltrehalose trehalohydrolase
MGVERGNVGNREGGSTVIDDPELPRVGVTRLDDGRSCWRVWAPNAKRVELLLGQPRSAERVPMEAEPHGYFACRTPAPRPTDRYAYALDGGTPLPDPYSRWQPDGVRGWSALWDPNQHRWDENGWDGIARSELVFYELHVGTFTPEGTFDAIVPRVESLLELGITAIELMPVAQFSGARGWGYDGVFPFAPQNSYGGPDGLQRLVEACHQRGMAVFVDVVYNHFGPDGNVFPTFGPYLTEQYKTGWGPAVNYDGRGSDAVRAMVIENARSWVRDFHVDGLRLDASDQIYDRSPRHILAEIAEAARIEAAKLGRRVHVFAETDANDAPRWLGDGAHLGYALDGQWNDDFHHAAHALLTRETDGYFIDFADGPAALAKTFKDVFVNDGSFSPFRGRRHGTSAAGFSGDRFVACTQNHDQIGNRLRGDRHAASLEPSALRLAAGILLLAPRLPLLFMGQEYGETNPFTYFCDFEDHALAEAVRAGRKAEFAHFGWSSEPLDPGAQETRDLAVLSWTWSDPVRAGLRRLHADLLRLRRESPALRDFGPAPARLLSSEGSPDVLEVIRGQTAGVPVAPLTILFNLGAEERAVPEPLRLAAVGFRSEVPAYGSSEAQGAAGIMRPHEFVIFGQIGTPVRK